MAIVGVDSEPAPRGSVPAVEDGFDFQAAVTEPERDRLLLGPVAGVARDSDGHAEMVPAARNRFLQPGRQDQGSHTFWAFTPSRVTYARESERP